MMLSESEHKFSKLILYFFPKLLSAGLKSFLNRYIMPWFSELESNVYHALIIALSNEFCNFVFFFTFRASTLSKTSCLTHHSVRCLKS